MRRGDSFWGLMSKSCWPGGKMSGAEIEAGLALAPGMRSFA
jgi:hypothetical protein